MAKHRRTRPEGALMALGSALFAVALDVFLIPNRIAPGGISGFASIATVLFGVPTGALTLLLNLPLFVWGGSVLGWPFLRKTVFATAALAVFVDWFTFLPAYTGDRLLACLYGGLIGGAGLALVFLQGGSTGGFDIIAKMVSRRFPSVSLGRVLLALDLAVAVTAALAYRDAESALYTVVALFLTSQSLDRLLAGMERGRLAIVITQRPHAVMEHIFADVGRGATLLPAQGGFAAHDVGVVLCAMRVGEVSRLHKAVKAADEAAFLVMTEAVEIAGEGFLRP